MTESKSKLNVFSDYAIETQAKVYNSLQGRPKTTQEIAKELRMPYSSVRLAVRVLEDEGEIRAEPGIHRNVKYSISGDPNGPNRIVPIIQSLTGQKYKLWVILQQRNTIEPKASQAVKDLPKHIVQLLNHARRLNNDPNTSTKSLIALKKRVQEDRDVLRNALSFYEQFLNNPKNWNPATLIKFPADIDWPEDEIEEAYTFYFRKD